MRSLGLVVAALFVVVGCSSKEETKDPPTPENDTGVVLDTSTTPDSAKPDTETPVDSAKADADSPADTSKEETAVDSALADTAPEDTFDSAVCSTIGQLCNDAQPCPGDQICYGSAGNGFCAPATPQCGGFVGKLCSGGRRCVRAGGSSLGYCATPEERPCLCEKGDAGYTVDCE